MKLKQSVTAVFLGVLLLAGLASAQYEPQIMKVKVPFSFEVNGREFPAGAYSLVRAEPNMLRLRDTNGRSLANILAGSVLAAESPNSAKLEFKTEGGRHVLARIWLENNPYGYELYPGKPAQLLAKKRNAQQATVEGP